MFFKKIDKLGRVYYYRENGKKVSAQTVKKSKKKVTQVATGRSIREAKRLLPKKVKRAKEAQEVQESSKKQLIGKQAFLATELIQQRVNSRIRGAYENGDKVGIKYKGEIYEVGSESELDLVALWESLESKFMNEIAGFQDSPTMTIQTIEGIKGIIFDFDGINWFGYSDDEGEELMEEFPEISESIKKTEKYFSGQMKKFIRNAKK